MFPGDGSTTTDPAIGKAEVIPEEEVEGSNQGSASHHRR